MAELGHVGADIGVRQLVRRHVNLDNLDAGIHRAFQLAREKRCGWILHHQDIGLFVDQRAHGLELDIRFEVGIADDQLDSVVVEMSLHDARPFGFKDAKPYRHPGDGLALHSRLEFLEQLGTRIRGVRRFERSGCDRRDCKSRRSGANEFKAGLFDARHVISSLMPKALLPSCVVMSSIAVNRPAWRSPRREDECNCRA